MLRNTQTLATLPKQPALPGFVVPRIGKERKWLRFGLMALLAFLMFVYSAFFALLPRSLLLVSLLPFFALLGMIIWALPVGSRVPGAATSRLFWAYSITLLLWPNYLALSFPGLPWITAARLLGAPMAFLLLIYASTSQPFRAAMKERLAPAKPLWKFVALFAILQVLTIAISDEPFFSLNRVANQLVIWTAMFFGAVWVFSSPKRLERWLIAYVVMIFILGLIAVREAQLEHVLWANHIPSFLKIEDEAVQRVLAGTRRLTGQYRTVATSTTALSFAELMALGAPFALYLLHSYPRWWVILGVGALNALVLYALVQTDSRLGFVGFAMGNFLYLLFYAVDRRGQFKNDLFGAALLMVFPAIMALGVMAVLFVHRIRVRILGGGQHKYSNDARSDQFDMAMDKIWASPVFGFGSGRGGHRLGFTNPAGTLTVDSYYITILMDFGFVGFFVFYGMLIYAIWQCAKLAVSRSTDQVRRLAAALGIVLAEFLVIKSVLSQEANHPVIFIVLGGVVSLMYFAKRDGKPAPQG